MEAAAIPAPPWEPGRGVKSAPPPRGNRWPAHGRQPGCPPLPLGGRQHRKKRTPGRGPKIPGTHHPADTAVHRPRRRLWFGTAPRWPALPRHAMGALRPGRCLTPAPRPAIEPMLSPAMAKDRSAASTPLPRSLVLDDVLKALAALRNTPFGDGSWPLPRGEAPRCVRLWPLAGPADGGACALSPGRTSKAHPFGQIILPLELPDAVPCSTVGQPLIGDRTAAAPRLTSSNISSAVPPAHSTAVPCPGNTGAPGTLADKRQHKHHPRRESGRAQTTKTAPHTRQRSLGRRYGAGDDGSAARESPAPGSARRSPRRGGWLLMRAQSSACGIACTVATTLARAAVQRGSVLE